LKVSVIDQGAHFPNSLLIDQRSAPFRFVQPSEKSFLLSLCFGSSAILSSNKNNAHTDPSLKASHFGNREEQRVLRETVSKRFFSIR
jgi:hypothetical protein